MSEIKPEDFLIEEKYHPQKIEDIILPNRIKKFVNGIIESGNILNYVFSGPGGCGKTTIAKFLAKTLNIEYDVIQGSINNGIDDVRRLEDLANTETANGRYRLIIIDEADYLSGPAQAGLRNVMNVTIENCRWILPCNYPHRLIKELRDSRTPTISFEYSEEERKEMSTSLWKRLNKIIKEEGWRIEDNRSFAEFMMSKIPNIRLILKLIQMSANSNNGVVSRDINMLQEDLDFPTLIKYIKMDLPDIRRFVSKNPQSDIFNLLYENFEKITLDADQQAELFAWISNLQGQRKGSEDIYTTTMLLQVKKYLK